MAERPKQGVASRVCRSGEVLWLNVWSRTFSGASLSSDSKDALWARFFMGEPQIQRSQESLRALAKGCGVNPKTIAKWKGRTSVADAFSLWRTELQ